MNEKTKYCKYCDKEISINDNNHWGKHHRGHLYCKKKADEIHKFYSNPILEKVYDYLIEHAKTHDKGYIFNANHEMNRINKYNPEILGFKNRKS